MPKYARLLKSALVHLVRAQTQEGEGEKSIRVIRWRRRVEELEAVMEDFR